MAAGVCVWCCVFCVWHVACGDGALQSQSARCSDVIEGSSNRNSDSDSSNSDSSEPALTVIVCDFCTTLQQKTAKRETSCGVFSAPRLLSRQRRDRQARRQAGRQQAGKLLGSARQAGRQSAGSSLRSA